MPAQPSIRDMGQSQTFAAGRLVGADQEDAPGLGEFYVAQQVKFSVLQTLILLELALTSSSKVIYTLSGCGIGLLWFFTILLRDDKISKSLVVFYPLLIMITTALLSVIISIKVFFVAEQTDLSLVFLGVAFTSDNLLLIREVIPQNVLFLLSQGGSATLQAGGYGRGSVASVEEAKPSCTARFFAHFAILNALQDYFVSFVIVLSAAIAGVICVIHSFITLPLSFIFGKLILDPYLRRWEKQENVKRNQAGQSGTMLNPISDDDHKRVRKATMLSVFLYTTLLVVDLEFLALAIALAEYTGGAFIGGQPFNSNNPDSNNCNCG